MIPSKSYYSSYKYGEDWDLTELDKDHYLLLKKHVLLHVFEDVNMVRSYMKDNDRSNITTATVDGKEMLFLRGNKVGHIEYGRTLREESIVILSAHFYR